MLFGLNVQVTPASPLHPVELKFTVWVDPLIGETVSVASADCPAGMEAGTADPILNAKSLTVTATGADVELPCVASPS
jgi:hypothetical protein